MNKHLSLALASFVVLPLTGCPPMEYEETPDAAMSCPTTTGPGTLHNTRLDRSETWTAVGNPHVVQGPLSLSQGVQLTLDPCVRVVFRADVSLTVAQPGSRLVADGEAQRPITFEAQPGARWNQIAITHPASASLRHVRLSGGGGDRFYRNATLVLRGDTMLPAKPVARLDHVSVTDSLGAGIVAERAGTFAPGSGDLLVTRSGSDAQPIPVVIGEHAIDGLPTGDYRGNRVDEVLVDPEGADGRGGLLADTVMRDRGVPYRIGNSPVDRFVIGHGGATAPRRTTLTVEPGVTMRFHPGTRLEVEHYTGPFAASGVLRAVGTPTRPIVSG